MEKIIVDTRTGGRRIPKIDKLEFGEMKYG